MSSIPQPSLPSAPLAPFSQFPRLAASVTGRSGPGASARALQATSHAPTHAPSVLVVEPDERARTLLSAALARAGFETVGVANAEEAQRALSGDRPLPVMVVSEVGLAGADGFALCSQLRAELRTAHLPILLLARSSEPYHRDLATHAGADDYLVKPVFVNDVVSLVRLKSSPRALDGSFMADTTQLPIPELIRALLAGVRSGRVDFGAGKARVVFRQGRIVDASFGTISGEDALLRLLLLSEGTYQVALGPSLERAAFSMGLREFCTRVFPRALRWRELVAKSVPLTALLALDFARLKERLSELPDGLNPVLRLFDGFRRVLDVILESPLEEVVTLEVITRLYALGVIAPLPARDEEERSTRAPSFFEASTPGNAPSLEQRLFGDLEALPQFDAQWQEPGLGTPLPPELARQLEAFRIRPVVEPAEPRPLTPEMTAFTQGAPVAEDASLASALANAPELIAEQELVPETLASAPTAQPLHVPQVVPEPAPVEPVPALSLVPAAPEAPAPVPLARIQLRPTPAPMPAVELVSARIEEKVPLNPEAEFFRDEPEAPVAEAPAAQAPVALPVVSAPAASAEMAAESRGLSRLLVAATALALIAAAVAVTALPGGELGLPPLKAQSAAVAPIVPVPAAAAPTPLPMPEEAVVAEAQPEPPDTDALQQELAEGIKLYDSGKLKDAVERLQQVVEADPASATGWLFLGLARFDALDRQGAESAALRALELDPRSGRAMILLASVYLDAGQRPRAEVELRRYLELEPQGQYAEEAKQLLSAR